MLSTAVIGVTGLLCLVTPTISASTAGFTLSFASMIINELYFLVCFEWRCGPFFYISRITPRSEDLSH